MPLLVVGLGSELSGDDAIGLVLVETVRGSLPEGVSCLSWPETDALTIAHDLLALEGPVLFVDCADMGLPPGSARLVSERAARVLVKHGPVSIHGIGLAEALGLTAALGRTASVHLFCVQPFDLSPGRGLSDAMRSRVPDLTRALEDAIRGLAAGSETGGAGGPDGTARGGDGPAP